MEKHLSFITIMEFLKTPFKDNMFPEIEKHLKECNICREHLAFLSILLNTNDNIHPKIPLEKGLNCPGDIELLLSLNENDKTIKEHINLCPFCTERLEELIEDKNIFTLMEQEKEEYEKPITEKIDEYIYSLFRRIKEAIIGDSFIGNYYPSVVEYAVILILIFITAFGFIKVFNDSMKEQYARTTGKIVQPYELNSGER